MSEAERSMAIINGLRRAAELCLNQSLTDPPGTIEALSYQRAIENCVGALEEEGASIEAYIEAYLK